MSEMSELSVTTIVKNAIKEHGGTCSNTHMLSKDASGGLAFLFDFQDGTKGIVKVIMNNEE